MRSINIKMEMRYIGVAAEIHSYRANKVDEKWCLPNGKSYWIGSDAHTAAQHLLFDWKILEILIYCHWTQFSFSSETIFFCLLAVVFMLSIWCVQRKAAIRFNRPIAIGDAAWNQKACRPYEYWSFFIFELILCTAVVVVVLVCDAIHGAPVPPWPSDNRSLVAAVPSVFGLRWH